MEDAEPDLPPVVDESPAAAKLSQAAPSTNADAGAVMQSAIAELAAANEGLSFSRVYGYTRTDAANPYTVYMALPHIVCIISCLLVSTSVAPIVTSLQAGPAISAAIVCASFVWYFVWRPLNYICSKTPRGWVNYSILAIALALHVFLPMVTASSEIAIPTPLRFEHTPNRTKMKSRNPTTALHQMLMHTWHQ